MSFYITVMQRPSYKQMTIDDLLDSDYLEPVMISSNKGNTKTYEVDYIPDRISRKVNVPHLISVLRAYNERTEKLHAENMGEMYDTFFVPKKSGHGMRRIDSPHPELMSALDILKKIFENEFRALYHTSAFAYVKGRSAIDSVKRHQANESKWFAKFDLHNFFGSTTKEFVMSQFAMVFPFSEVLRDDSGRAEFDKAISLAFLNGGLPQGTPVSPIITNIMMIPIDFKLSKTFREFDGNRFVYTRYADDFLVSSKRDFNCRAVEDVVIHILKEFSAPFSVNESKTRYGSSSGRNWNLGVMLNKDNEITIGHKKKKIFSAMVNSYILDRIHGHKWSSDDVRTLDGLRSYYVMVEGETIRNIVKKTGDKYGVDIDIALKEDLKAISKGVY